MLKHVQATVSGQSHGSRRQQSVRSTSGSVTNLSDTRSTLCRSSSQLAIPTAADLSRRSPSVYSNGPLSITSRASSFASLSVVSFDSKLTPIKVYASCLRSDIEYKTLGISHQTTSTEVIWMLLSKYKMRHRDPKLFYLTMEINFASDNGDGSTSNSSCKTLCLDDDSRPAELKICYPKGDCKFTLQMRKGGLIRVYDSVLMAESNYKCLLISDNTTVAEVINILFHCYGLERVECVSRYCMLEVNNGNLDSARKLQPDDCPAVLQLKWTSPDDFKWVLHRECTTSSVISSTLSDGVEAMSTTSSTSSYSSSGTVSERSLSSCDETVDDKDYSMNYNNYITSYNKITGKSNRRVQSCTKVMITNSKKDPDFRPTSSTIPSSSLQPQNVSSILIEHCPVNADRPPRSLPCILPPRRNMPTIPASPPHRQLPKPNFNLNVAINTAFSQSQSQPHPSNASLTSIHESGLPSTPLGRSYQQSSYLLSRQEHSLVWLAPGTRKPLVALRDYENYFYI